MLRLLTDEHLSPVVAAQVRMKRPAIAIQSIHEWRNGSFRGKIDLLLLRAANDEGLTLLTYDQSTIPPLLMEFTIAKENHGGIIFVDGDTISSNDYGGLVRAIIAFYERCAEWEWANRISFLEREP